MPIFIGGAWPYANGPLHLGHIASLLPGDVLARYYRQKGERVLYVSGSDCHGTPISLRAAQEDVDPGVITERYHNEFIDCFRRLGFSYDFYSRTDQIYHHQVVQEFFLSLLKNGLIYKQQVLRPYCDHCHEYLPDRFVEGNCPYCTHIARGDQCDHCGNLLDPTDLRDPHCKICNTPAGLRESEHFFLALGQLQQKLEAYVSSVRGWRKNAVQLTHRYLKEGLPDRAISRDLNWGVDIPLPEYSGKKIYVWIDAVVGYLSASRQWAKISGGHWEEYWSDEAISYFIHGKDNIPFHSLILPALLMGLGELHLPDYLVSSEYLTIEGRKLSTSGNWAVWVPDILERYDPDAIRYFLIINGPEKRDTDFSWREFINSCNSELLGAYGNFVHRTLTFVERFYNNIVPAGNVPAVWREEIRRLCHHTGERIEKAEFKGALEDIFAVVRQANKFFDEHKPWKQINESPADCNDTIYTSCYLIANLANILQPFLPFSTTRICDYLGLEASTWAPVELTPCKVIKKPQPLFGRIDKSRIDEELVSMGKS